MFITVRVKRKCLALQFASKMSKCEQDKRSKKSKILKDAHLNLNLSLLRLSVPPISSSSLSTKIDEEHKYGMVVSWLVVPYFSVVYCRY